MAIEFSPAVIDACSTFVITLDRHPVGAAALVVVLLAGGAAVALAKWRPNSGRHRAGQPWR